MLIFHGSDPPNKTGHTVVHQLYGTAFYNLSQIPIPSEE